MLDFSDFLFDVYAGAGLIKYFYCTKKIMCIQSLFHDLYYYIIIELMCHIKLNKVVINTKV